jgi:type IV pilus assembly protein PilY1
MRTRPYILVALLSALLGTAGASAQTPDIRDIPPVILLLVDTSGSMERRPDCVCTTTGCAECYPVCASGTYDRSRWVTLLEALTGSFNDYTCSRENRTGGPYAGAYDEGYFIPHFPYSFATQNNDGILDIYDARVKFGLMTFDAVGTHIDHAPLMTSTDYAALGAARFGPKGDYSYGGEKPFMFPNCGEPHAMDNGVRRASTNLTTDFVPGGLVPPGTDGAYSGVGGSNLAIQTALLDPRLRPFGATPIAGAFDDLDHFMSTDASVTPSASAGDGRDPYYACRDRYAILITDGYPNADMRGEPVFCEATGQCPYDTVQNLASSLVSDHLDGIYVVGFDQTDPHARPILESIAEAGKTEAPLWANDLPGLRTALSEILDRAAPGTTTRTVPALSSVSPSTLAAMGPRLAQLQVLTGFKVGSGATVDPSSFEPWSGVLERRRFECNGLDVEERDIESQDRFHDLLNVQSIGLTARRLLTVTPPEPTNPVTAHFRGRGAAELTARGGGLLPTADPTYTPPAPGVFNVSDMTPFIPSNIPEELLEAPPGLHLPTIYNMHAGDASVPRFGKAMGAIYHSSPVIVPPPAINIDDEGYNAYSQGRLLTGNLPVSERPRVIYVSTVEGVIHALLADDFTHASIGSYTAGHELWGFIPPMFLKLLHQNLNSSPQFTDGTPVVREIFDARTDAQIGNEAPFRTVLVTGMRAGGPGYVALDVTDPFEPKFLWQFYDSVRLGPTVAEPAIAQVRVNGVSRGVVFLPGGEGELLLDGPAACHARRPPASQNANQGRPQRRCWKTKGRSLFAVDAVTGVVLRHWDHTELDAPLTGAISVFNGQTAAIATRAFMTDADGMMHRLDLTHQDPAQWELAPFFDLFQFTTDPSIGSPAVHAPVISTDDKGQVVILAATGDIDVLTDETAQNVVVSLTEVNVFGTAPVARLNWQIVLDPGELVTGPLDLFSGQAFFGVFQPMSSASNLCMFGHSRLFGAHYVRTQNPLNPSDVTPEGVLPALTNPTDPSVLYYDRTDLPALDNTILTGLRVAARPNCALGLDADTNVYPVSQRSHRVSQVGAAQYQLVGQLAGGAGTAGGTVGEMRVNLLPPSGVTHGQAFAGSVD